ncbi:hypothetical protein SK128_028531 [Halocaridina rubra]|uniref:Pinin n=1 Tax=Halocaridina rubra TaxID=373956 RepID=A0AAN8X710_HALRR
MAAMMSGLSLVSTIQNEIEKAQLDLKGVDENLRKLTGRDFGEPNQRPEQRRRLLSGGRDDEPPAKRRPQGVFARLGGVVLEQHYNESRGRGRGGFRRNSDTSEPRSERGEGRGDLRTEILGGERGGRRVQEVAEEDDSIPKPSLASSVARPQVDFKSRTEAAAELTKDRASRDRNRRMFGALLGTLKRFKNDEAKQKDKEEQRAAIDRKLEEKGRAEKEELRRERLDLFNQRKERQAQIRRLTVKMARVKEHEAWESHMMRLTKFIRTKSSPRIFWLPQSHISKTTNLVRATHDIISRELEEDRQRLKEELDEIIGSRAEDDQGDEGRDAAEGGEEEDEESESFIRRGVRSEIARQGEGGAISAIDNSADLLDYEAEEGELVYDEADLSGKDTNDTERVVVQVDGRGIGGRKVEIVGGQSLDRPEGIGKLSGGNDSEKENQAKKDEIAEAMSPDPEADLEATVVHIKIEKDEDNYAKESGPLVSTVKTEKDDIPRRIMQEEIPGGDAQPDGELPPSPTIAVPLPTDSPSPPRECIPNGTSVPLPTLAAGETSSTEPPFPPLPTSLPLPPATPTVFISNITSPPYRPSSPLYSPSYTPAVAPPPGKEIYPTDVPGNQMEVCESKTEASLPLPSAVDVIPDDTVKQDSPVDDRKSRHKTPKDEKKVSEKSEKSKKKSDDKKGSDRKKTSATKKSDDKKGSKKVVLGTSDESSSEESSSESSSESSESESSDSESSSSSGSSSDSESDSSSSSSSDSQSGGEKKKKAMKKRGKRQNSRSEDSSSDSEKEEKLKKKRKHDQVKSKESKKTDPKIKVKEEPVSDDEKTKKSSSKDRKRDVDKIDKEKESRYKSRDNEKDRDSTKRKDREQGKSSAAQSKSREKKRERSRSRDQRHDSRSRDKNRRDRKDRKDRR